jgi:NADH:ubiquinone oxidoreductase subunit E
MQIANYIQKYTKTSSNKHLILARDKINSTHKWVEYALDIMDMSALLMQTKDLKQKYALMDALDIAQRKKDWHYRQDNFRLQDAMRIFETAKQITKK